MSARAAPARRRRWLRGAANLAFVAALLGAVNFIPPDTSLDEVRRTGLLRACVPTLFPPLVTGDPAAPGHDVELLDEIARRLGLRLSRNVNPSMGNDFNPRNWNLTRAQCEVVAGGVVDSPLTRGFLQTLPTGPTTGWVILGAAPAAAAAPAGLRLGVYPGASGLDRLALSGFLRSEGAAARLAPSPAALEEGLASGRFDAIVTDRFQAEAIARGHPDWPAAWLAPDRLERYPLALGLWKGDVTLKRAVDEALGAMRADGTLARLRGRYGIGCGPGADTAGC
jgi:ABC-type amino acid transport substrate-binding protein